MPKFPLCATSLRALVAARAALAARIQSAVEHGDNIDTKVHLYLSKFDRPQCLWHRSINCQNGDALFCQINGEIEM